jgi:signal transduction histidine kinase
MLDDPVIARILHQSVMESAAAVLALQLDSSFCVTDANALACRVLPGITLGRPLAEQVVDFHRTLDLPALIRQEGAVHRLTLNTAAGMPETLDFRFFPLPEGTTLALASLDLQEQLQLREAVLGLNSELNNLTRQLHQANAELRELNQLKNQFLGMAAHDLRAPAGLIISYSEFVLDEAGEKLSAEHREFLRICLSAANGMKQLIENFLDVSVIESGQLRLKLAPATVTGILAGVRPVAALLAGKKKISLLEDAPDDGRPLRVDAPKLQQVLLNLIGNAVQHSLPGRRVWLSSRRDGANLVFAVRDESQGISPEDQARLFTAFGQAGTRKTAGERSTGLGLAIARKVVEAHGGRIWVKSLPGQGATFLFSLPTQPTPT